MNTINNIAVFDNDKCFLAMLDGYCYANDIVIITADFNMDGINEVVNQKPILTLVPLDLVSAANKRFETSLLRQTSARGRIKIGGLNKNPIDSIPDRLLEWVDVIFNNPYDIGEIDDYIKKNFLMNSCLIEKRSYNSRRTTIDRRNIEYNNGGDDGIKVAQSSGYPHKAGNHEVQGLQIDQRSKCLFLRGHKVDLTPKEFELIELLSTDSDRVFNSDEIISHLWPQSKRASKSDVYQYMHLIRKKIEINPNNPQWILNVKGFGYKLNTNNPEEIDRECRWFPEYA